jgi:4-amino-4-deoxy-L-arabinose transferase-like glycosyltransferase
MDHDNNTADADRAPRRLTWDTVPDWFVVSTLLTLGLLLRITAIRAHSFSVDEAGTWLAASRPLSKIVPFLCFTNEVHPPFYFYFVHCWMYMGNSEWVLRMSSIVFGVLDILFTWLIAREMLDRRSAFWAAAFITFSSFHITYSQELRMYPMLVFFFLLSIWCLLRWLGGRGTAWLVATTAVNILSLHTHYLTVFLIAVEGLYILARIREYRKLILPYIICQAVTMLAFIPWLWHYITSEHMQDFSLRFLPGLTEVLLLLCYFFMGFHHPPLHPVIAGTKVDLYDLAGVVITLLTLLSLIRQKGWQRVFLSIYLLLPLLGITLLSRYTSIRIFEFKYFMIIIPAFFILMGATVSALRSVAAKVVVLALFLALNGISWLNFAFDDRYAPQNWRMASWILHYYAKANDVILIHPSMMGGGLYYYYHGRNRILPVDSFDGKELAAELSKYDNVWFCTTPFHPYVERAGLEKWLDANYRETSATVFPPRSYVLSNVILIKTFEIRKGEGPPNKSRPGSTQ